MFQVKVFDYSGSIRVMNFKEFSRQSVLARYNQLVSEGDILGFEVV
jgi:hypothetical protein